MSDRGGTPFEAVVVAGQVLAGTPDTPGVTAAAPMGTALTSSAFAPNGGEGIEGDVVTATRGVANGSSADDADPGICAADAPLARGEEPSAAARAPALSTTLSRAGTCTVHATAATPLNTTAHSAQTILALIGVPFGAAGVVAEHEPRSDLDADGAPCLIEPSSFKCRCRQPARSWSAGRSQAR